MQGFCVNINFLDIFDFDWLFRLDVVRTELDHIEKEGKRLTNLLKISFENGLCRPRGNSLECM